MRYSALRGFVPAKSEMSIDEAEAIMRDFLTSQILFPHGRSTLMAHDGYTERSKMMKRSMFCDGGGNLA
jgi:hypothetical protein